MVRPLTPGVTLPRRILPGSTYMISRRVLRRTSLFRPDRSVARRGRPAAPAIARWLPVTSHDRISWRDPFDLAGEGRLPLYPRQKGLLGCIGANDPERSGPVAADPANSAGVGCIEYIPKAGAIVC